MAFENDPNEVYAVTLVVHSGGRFAAEYLLSQVANWYDEEYAANEEMSGVQATVGHVYPITSEEADKIVERDFADAARTFTGSSS